MSARIVSLTVRVALFFPFRSFLQTRSRWDGTDDRGAAVASGVDLVRADDGVTNRTLKVALVR